VSSQHRHRSRRRAPAGGATTTTSAAADGRHLLGAATIGTYVRHLMITVAVY
jgi:hypothetical protein